MKTPCIKISQYKSQAKKKKIPIVISTISLLVPYPNKFVVVCICIVIFCGGLNFFFVSCGLGLGIFQISWGPSVLGVLISFLGEGARPFCSIKPSMTNHVNSRTVDSKIMFHVMCAC